MNEKFEQTADAEAESAAERKWRERRAYERFSTDFTVFVSGTDPNGDEWRDETQLHDISGGGLSFYTSSPEHYAHDAKVSVMVLLPEVNHDRRDVMRGEATVVWIGAPDARQGARVGVELDQPLQYERF